MSLGEAIGLAVIILGGMFAMLFGLAAVEEGMFAAVVEPETEIDPAPGVLPPDVEPLQQVA